MAAPVAAPAQIMPSAPVTPQLPAGPAAEQIKRGPKEDGKGASLSLLPSLTPTSAKIETSSRNPF